jgi:hypothetical protein
MKRVIAAIGLVGLLTACGGGEEVLDDPVEAPLAGGEDFDATATEAADQADAETPAGEIPAKYLGVWDYEKGTCDEASDMRMNIEARKITFYESIGNVSGTGTDEGDAVVDLAMSGEGEEWVESLRLTIVDTPDGERLYTSDATKPKVKDEYPRKRCK